MSMSKVKAAIIGSGNIGTDLMYKLEKSDVIEVTDRIVIDKDSDGMKIGAERGYKTFANCIQGVVDEPDVADIFFDAASAKAHIEHARILKELDKMVIDLTPAAVGPFFSPAVGNTASDEDLDNVNMITCGGQATIPMVYAVNQVADVAYAEIVATISSLSAGPGTRANIDEFTITTGRGIEVVGGADEGKAIIILNPADPPIMMRDTIYCEVKDMDEEKVTKAINEMVETVQQYVPGYRLKQEPLFEDNKVTIFVEVEG